MNGKYGNRIDKYCYPLTLLRLRSRKFSCGVFCLFTLMQLFACEYNYLHHIVIYLVNRRAHKTEHAACAIMYHISRNISIKNITKAMYHKFLLFAHIPKPSRKPAIFFRAFAKPISNSKPPLALIDVLLIIQ